MHAHHKNLLRDFWLISPGKTPTGKTSQREERFLFLQQKYWTEIQWKYYLSSPQNFISKFWKLNSAKRTQPYTSISVPKLNADRTVINDSRIFSKTMPNKWCPYLENCAGINAAVLQAVPRFLCWIINAVRTAINAGRTDPYLLDFCAGKLMQTVQH